MLHDLDTALRSFVEREISAIGDVEIDFDAPTKDWATRRNAPTIDIYLYDIRQDLGRAQFGEVVERNADGIITRRRPQPKYFRVAYLVTAWTQRAEDEHRLLSTLMAAFLKHDVVPADLLGGSLSDLGIGIPIAVALPPPQDRSLSDVWSALGGELKPSLDLSVIAPLLPDRITDAGPPVTKEPMITMGDRRNGTAETHGGRAMPEERRPGQDERRRPPPGPSKERSRAANSGQALMTMVEDASLDHVLGRLEVVRRRVAALVAARRAVDSSPEDPFLGLYLSDEKIDLLLHNDRVWVAHDVAADVRAGVEANADAAAAHGATLRLRTLAAQFDLDDFDLELLLVAMAPDVDDRFERYYGYLNDDVTRRRSSIGLALGLAGFNAVSRLGRHRLDAGARLVGGGLLDVEDPERPFLTRALHVPDRVTAHVLGADQPDAALAFVLVDVAPTAEHAHPALTRAIADHDTLTYVHDREASALQAAVDAAVAAGTPAVVVDLVRVAVSMDADRILDAAIREVRLRDGVLIAAPVDELAEANVTAVQRLTAAPVPMVLAGQRGWEPSWAGRPPFIVDAPRLTAAARARIWSAALGAGDVDAAAVTAPYRLGAGQIRQAARAAAAAARLAARPLDEADLRLGARQQNAARLERLARRIEPLVSWEDLVLPPNVAAGLHGLADRARHREQVLGVWRMRPGGGRGTGITALFAGDSGTGKTMSAEVIASDLGLDLYVVNLATVVDKYIGETEKNLDRIFAEADGINGVLLFDEADALFGQRSEVHDSHDRYANIEVAYLLQRMETFDGLAILATNLRSNVDEAFTRRLDAIVDFPMPDAASRRILWEHSIRPLPKHADLDLEFCASAFELSGGNIRSVAVTLGYRAAANGGPIDMADVIRAVAEEYRKLGRLCLEAEFGPYHPLLRPL